MNATTRLIELKYECGKLFFYFSGLSYFAKAPRGGGGFTLEKNDGDVPARTKFYDPALE